MTKLLPLPSLPNDLLQKLDDIRSAIRLATGIPYEMLAADIATAGVAVTIGGKRVDPLTMYFASPDEPPENGE